MMFPSPKRTRTTHAYNFPTAAFPARRFIAQVLAFMLLAQTIAPPAIAAPARGFSLASLANHASSLAAMLGNPGSGARATSARTVAVLPAAEEFGVVLTPLTTAFVGHAGIEHHQPLRKVVVSSNNPTGVPLNFEALDADGMHRPYSNVSGLYGGLKIATARDDGTGMSRGGFKPGELFSGTGVPGAIARVAPDGGSVQNPWVTLAGEGGQLSAGLFVDRTGVFGGDLIAVTTAGGVWRINSAGVAARIADLGTHLAGVTTLPDDATKYGPWAGKILAGAKDRGIVYAIDAQGNSTSYQLGINPEDIRIIPAHENFYGVDPAGGKIWGAPDDAFAGIIGDILIAQGSPGVLARVRWNGTDFKVGQIAQVEQWGQITFSPAALSEIGGVKQVYDKIAVVRHAPELNSGRVEGALWQLLPENVALNGTDVITSDLLVPGTPTVTVGSGKPSFDGVIEGVESTQPTGYFVSISNNASLRHVITRTNPISLMPVAAPPAPAGTRDVSLSKAHETTGNYATLRNLSISGKAGAVAVPPGVYGKFTATGHTQFVFGVEGATVPSVYNLEDLSLSGGSELRLVGPVKLNVRGNVSLSGSTVGAATNPQQLLLSVSHGTVGVTGNGVLYGIVRIPQGAVSIGGNGRIRGTVTCDRLNVHGNGVLQITENDIAPPQVNRPPTADAGPDQTITLPTEVVSLNGTATDDGLPSGSTLLTTWTKISGPGPVSFSALDNTVTTATFTDPGVYVLRLTANDSLLTVSDDVSVEVVPRNQPPVANAGTDQSVELPNGVTLAGVVSDDALPRGSTVTKTWSIVSGPGTAAFADPHDLATPVTFAAPGTYVLHLTADDTEFNASDEVVITVYPENQAPVVNAGPDQTLRLPNSATLNGAVTDDGLPPDSMLTTKWTKVSGPGGVTFVNDGVPVTAATFSTEGTYVLRLTADDTRFTITDECVITVLPENAPPAVNAGSDMEFFFFDAAVMNGITSDDGLPVGSILEVAWSQVSGPGVATFANSGSPVTGVTFSAPGTYVLRLTGDDTQFSASDEATVVVRPRPYASRVYTLNADFAEGDIINLTHSTPDQLQFESTTPSNTGAWSVVFDSRIAGAEWGRIGWTAQVCGDGLLTVSVAASEDNVTYTQPLIVSNGDDPAMPDGRFIKITASFERASSSESPILYDLSVGTVGFSLDTPANVAPGVDAGTDQTLNDTTTTTLRASVCDDALPSNQRLATIWSQVSGPGTTTFVQPNSSVTDVSFSAPGTYRLRMTATDSVHTNSDTLVVTVIPVNQPPVVNAGTDQIILLSAVASLSGTMTDDGLPSGGTLTATWSKLSGPGLVTFGDVHQPSTTASFAVAGDYVLRLEATDSEKGAFDDVAVTVLPNPNRPPDIISEPTTEFSLGPAPVGVGELVNLSPWTAKQYELNSQANANWVKDVANNTVTQIVNADASILLSDFDLSRAQMDGTWRVNTTSDDDFIGFVFGYQNSEHFYLFDWKKGSQSDAVGFGERGMSVKVVNADSTLTSRDFWPTAGNGTRVRTLYHNTVPWQSFIDYQFTLQFQPGEIKITVRQGAVVLADITVSDATYTNGLFGFYNYSQAQVKYSGFRRLALTQGTYTYDVEATDPDGDTLTYALDAAPSGMSIDPTTGLINWPVTSRAAGNHNVTIRVQDPHGAFDTQSYTLTILNQNQPPVVNAGDDRTISVNATAALNGSVTDDGLPRNASVNSSWSMASGPGLVAFANPASPATTATFSEAGTYVLRLTATDTALTASDETIITVTPPNQAPVVNAGTDQTITQPGTARLNGSVANDGLPFGSPLVVGWTQVSGPGTTTFANPVSASTTAIFTDPGVYILRLSVSDTELTSTDDVSVTVNPTAPNQAPVVDAGANQTVALNVNLVQNAGNDEQLAGGEIRAWTEAVGSLWTRGVTGAGGFPESVNGDGFFYAGEADSAELRQDVDVSAFAAAIAAGTQSFEWKASIRSRAESVSDTARVIVEYRNQSNTAAIAWMDSGEVSSVGAWRLLENTRTAPAGTGWIRLRLIATRRTGTTNDAYFDALSLRAVTGAGVKLSGMVNDDGLPAGGTLTTDWSKVSGPGTVTFSGASTVQTSATFSEAGIYVLRLSANDSELTSGDELTVTVEPRNLVPVVEAGADQIVTLPATASLNGTANDDGRPTAAVTSFWSKVSGPGAVTFADANALMTTAAFGAEGIYVLRLTIDDTEYSASDIVTITVHPVPSNLAPLVNAGADQLFNPPATSAVLSGTVSDDERPPGSSLTYVWTKVSGPGTVNFSSPAALVTTATFSEAGVYILRLTANDTELTGSDDVRVTLVGTNKAPVVNAGTDRTVAHPTTVTLAGAADDDGLPAASTLSFNWAKVSGPGSVTFANAASLQTTATFSAPGVYALRLRASDTELTGADEVTITQTPPPTVSISSPAEGATLTDRTNFVGTVSEGSTWRLEHSLNEEGSAPVWTTFASGSTPISNGVLGTFDPTLILNGIYTVRLVATSAAGQTATKSATVVVDGEQKVGNFRVSFTDLNVPLDGIPIEVIRTYDSRDKRVGDFGVGWTLDVRNIRLQESVDVGMGWQATVTSGFLPNYCLQPTRSHVVSITMPDNDVLRFEAVPGPQCSLLYPLGETTIRYRAMPGTHATLAPVGDATVLVNANFPGEAELLDYSTFDEKDFDLYRLTLPSGAVLIIDQRAGLREATDANGNKLTINSNGVTHSSGKSIAFTRDAQGRITRITDPAGNNLNYSYDLDGDLVSTSDQDGRTTRYTYNSSHGLLDIIDPMNRRGIRNEYDARGRLVSLTDEEGKTIGFEFDTNSRQQVITNRKGHVTVYEYDEKGNILSITDAHGKVTRATYDGAGNRLTETDQFGNTTTYTHDSRGNVLTKTDAQNRLTRYTYNARNQVTSVTDANGNTTANAYDAAGNVTSATDALGNATTFTYNPRGQMLTRTDAAAQTSSFEYNSFGNLTKETDRLGNIRLHTYDALGNHTSVTDAKGNVTQFNYNASGLLTATVDALGNVTRNEYDPVGNLSASVDVLGHRTEVTSNFRGMPLQTTHADGTQFRLQYDADGQLAGSSAPGGLTPTVERDSLSLPTKLTISPGISLGYQYDAMGRKTAESDPRGNTTSFQYNLLNKVTLQIDPLGNQTHYTYDAVGNLTSLRDGNGNTASFTYDRNNRRVRTTLPDGSFFENTYNSLGEVISQRDALGNVTTFTYDHEGSLHTVTQPGGGVTRYEYDSNGGLISSTDANGRKTVSDYDKLNRLVKRTHPDGTTELMTYDALGLATSQTDRQGRMTSFEYDNMNRISSVRYADAKTVAYTYTQSGKRDTVTDASGVIDFDYDALGRVTSVRYPDGTTIGYAYDLAGNRTKIMTPDGETRYSYDVKNRLAKVTDPRGLITSYTYDGVGNVVRVNHPNGLITAKAYDRMNQLSSIKTTNPDGNTVFHENYTRDANGRRTKVVQADGSAVEYAYDAKSRLTGETYKDADGNVRRQLAYTYDAVGNRLTVTDSLANTTVNYTYNGSDQLTSDGAHTFAYDANGNTISKTISASTTRYAYDARERLTQVTQPDNATLTYVYDANGNRVRAVDASGTVTKYVVDATSRTPEVLVETDSSGQVVASYTYGLELISQRRHGADSFYLHDALGSTRALTDGSGAVTDSYSYDAFGQLTSSSGTTVNSFLYTGQQNDVASGFYYLRARYYNPSAGRFLSMDPYRGALNAPATQHRYAYTQNNPVDATDPTGLHTRLEGTDIHKVLGQYYIGLYGDHFVDVMGYSPNRGFSTLSELPYGHGQGAYNRGIVTGRRWTVRPDLRHYGSGDVYEIKPLTPYGVSSAVAEAQVYTLMLNIWEKGAPDDGEWKLGTDTFWPPILRLPYGKVDLLAFSYPFAPPGAVFYTLNLEADLRNIRVISAAASAVNLLNAMAMGKMAMRLIQAHTAAQSAVIMTRTNLVPLLKAA